MAIKKILAIGDTHCGSMVGLTHPNWMVKKERNAEMYKLQVEMWDNYCQILDDFGKVDALIVNGDAIDGKSRAYREIIVFWHVAPPASYVSNFLVRPASSDRKSVV